MTSRPTDTDVAAISALTAEFKDRDLERRYRAEMLPEWRFQATVAMSIAAAGYLSFVINDYARFGWGESLYLVTALRLGTLAIVAAFYLVVRADQRFGVYAGAVVVAELGFAAIFFTIIILHPYRLGISTSLMVTLILAAHLFVPNRLILAVPTAAAGSVGFVFAAAGMMTTATDLRSVILQLIIFNAGGGLVAFRMHRLYRQRFAALVRERDINGRLEAQSTKLGKLAKRLAKARNEANHANRAKSEFLAHMSHELRAPLTAINGFSEIMGNEMLGPMPPRYRDYAADINRSALHLTALINDVLDLSKVEAGKLELSEDTVVPGDVVEACLRLVRDRAFKAGLRLRADLPPDLPALRADERLIKQILLNLLTNAIKFTPDGGQVRVAVLRMPDGGLALAVSDTGIGIAAEDLPRVIEPYGQVASTRDRNPDGTGLGLALVTKMVELHGGTLVLESTPDRGTTATVTLPAERVLATATAPVSPSRARAG